MIGCLLRALRPKPRPLAGFWGGLMARLTLCAFIIAGLAIGSAGMTTWRAHPYLLDRVLGGQPAPLSLPAEPYDLEPGAGVTQSIGETLELQRWQAFDTYRFEILDRHTCRDSDWYLQRHTFPAVMIVYRDDAMEPVEWHRSVASMFEVRPWSFDNLKGKYDVWAVCDR